MPQAVMTLLFFEDPPLPEGAPDPRREEVLGQGHPGVHDLFALEYLFKLILVLAANGAFCTWLSLGAAGRGCSLVVAGGLLMMASLVH